MAVAPADTAAMTHTPLVAAAGLPPSSHGHTFAQLLDDAVANIPASTARLHHKSKPAAATLAQTTADTASTPGMPRCPCPCLCECADVWLCRACARANARERRSCRICGAPNIRSAQLSTTESGSAGPTVLAWRIMPVVRRSHVPASASHPATAQARGAPRGAALPPQPKEGRIDPVTSTGAPSGKRAVGMNLLLGGASSTGSTPDPSSAPGPAGQQAEAHTLSGVDAVARKENAVGKRTRQQSSGRSIKEGSHTSSWSDSSDDSTLGDEAVTATGSKNTRRPSSGGKQAPVATSVDVKQKQDAQHSAQPGPSSAADSDEDAVVLRRKPRMAQRKADSPQRPAKPLDPGGGNIADAQWRSACDQHRRTAERMLHAALSKWVDGDTADPAVVVGRNAAARKVVIALEHSLFRILFERPLLHLSASEREARVPGCISAYQRQTHRVAAIVRSDRCGALCKSVVAGQLDVPAFARALFRHTAEYAAAAAAAQRAQPRRDHGGAISTQARATAAGGKAARKESAARARSGQPGAQAGTSPARRTNPRRGARAVETAEEATLEFQPSPARPSMSARSGYLALQSIDADKVRAWRPPDDDEGKVNSTDDLGAVAAGDAHMAAVLPGIEDDHGVDDSGMLHDAAILPEFLDDFDPSFLHFPIDNVSTLEPAEAGVSEPMALDAWPGVAVPFDDASARADAELGEAPAEGGIGDFLEELGAADFSDLFGDAS